MSSIKSFEDLDVWKVGRQIRGELYALTSGFPKQEQYCLGQQVRTAAISLTANIAEGYGRFHYKENIQFCRIARGSAYELLDHLIACRDLGYVADKQCDGLRNQLQRFVQLLNGYIRSIGQVGNKGVSDSSTNDE
ncbi:MAG: four helix bundle protein [Nitrospirae bacterium]|nr:four helix bundle protein [Nitrospirota bacterium]